MADLRALTFIQPWGTAALTVKPVENRNFPPPRWLVGKRFAVHAGAKLDTKDAWGLAKHLRGVDLGDVPQSALLGTVELAGFVRIMKDSADSCGLSDAALEETLGSKWRHPDARCLWVLRNPLSLEEPIPCKGSLGLWRVPERHVEALLAADGRPFAMEVRHG